MGNHANAKLQSCEVEVCKLSLHFDPFVLSLSKHRPLLRSGRTALRQAQGDRYMRYFSMSQRIFAGNRLKHLRADRAMKQSEFAAQLGISTDRKSTRLNSSH